jgi:hypothetical protein
MYRQGGLGASRDPAASARSNGGHRVPQGNAQPNHGVGADPSSVPRASTGMPRESWRGADVRSAPSAPQSRAPSMGAPAPQSNGGGGASGGGGGSYRGGDGGGGNGNGGARGSSSGGGGRYR